MKVVVVTPNEVDGSASGAVLAEQGLEVLTVASLAQAAPLVNTDIACVVLVEEAFVESEMPVFQEALQAQPAWSDLPLILIAARESSLAALVEGAFPRSGNVTILQRPLHPLSLVSAVQVALRSREHQVEMRGLLEQRELALRRRDEFLAMLAHELRNPLAPIRNAVHLLGSVESADPLFVKCRAMIEKQSRHIARLVDDLLDVSRLELGKVELRIQTVDVNQSLAAAVDACVPMTGARHHTVNLRRWKEPLTVRADPVRLEQVIGNLIVNAAKFTPDGGTIDVEASVDDGCAVISVTDNGIGVKPDKLDAIFELFTQENVSSGRTEGGLGIGLTLVKRLVELHGGSVRAFSAGSGAGARFEVRLPRDRRGSSRDLAESAPAPGPAARRVLIVEDGADTRVSLGMLLSMWKHEVIYASTGPEGLLRAREEQPDVALIDIGLPGFDGYNVARQIRGENTAWSRNVRLIALTGYGQESDRVRALDAGFDVHVRKPVDPAELRTLLTPGS